MRTRRGPSGRWWLIAIICWILSVIGFTGAIVHQAKNVADWDSLPKHIHNIQIYKDGDNDSTTVHINFDIDEDIDDDGYLEIEE